MSARRGDRVLITRRGAMLGHLTEQDLVETGIYQDDSATPLASSDLEVHRAIYRHTPALAVVHAHPRTAIALSLLEDEIIPVDAEGSYHIPRVPVVAAAATDAAQMAQAVAPALTPHQIVLVRGHGCFAAGQSLEEAYHKVSCLEESCQVLYYLRILRGER